MNKEVGLLDQLNTEEKVEEVALEEEEEEA